MAAGPFSPTTTTPIDETSLEDFLQSTSSLPVEEWQKRLTSLKKLVDSIPDYSTSTTSSQWYRSSKHVRRLSPPLKQYLLDARSALVKEATELIGTLLMVKLQRHPETAADESRPPPFVGRLLLKDLLPPLLQLSSQTVKVIRNYGTALLLDVLPHCRVPSSLVLLCDRMRSDKNRIVKEDCARYLRCVLETWPCDDTLLAMGCAETDPDTADDTPKIPMGRNDECLTIELVKQIGSDLGRSLTDPAQPVRNESRRGFQVVFRRFRPLWDELMTLHTTVVRDVRLRKKLLEAAARSDGRDVDELTLDDGSIGGLSYGSVRSGVSQLTMRSYASRGMGQEQLNGSDTPKARTRAMQTFREASSEYSSNAYVTTSGQVFSTPSPRRQSRGSSSGGKEVTITVTRPFGSLLKTPLRKDRSPMSPSAALDKVSSTALRRRLSRRISGVGTGNDGALEEYRRHLSSINEMEDKKCGNRPSGEGDEQLDGNEVTTVALEVIEAHLSHLRGLQEAISKENELLSGMEELSGIPLKERNEDLSTRLVSLSEDQVCDYFESLHLCVDAQVALSENFLREMERISRGGRNGGD